MRQAIRKQWVLLLAACVVMLLGVVLMGCSSGGNQAPSADSTNSQAPASEAEASGVDDDSETDGSDNQEISESDLYAMDLILREYLKDGDTEDDAYEGMRNVFSSEELDALREWRASGGVNPYADEEEQDIASTGKLELTNEKWIWNPDDKGRGRVTFTLTNDGSEDYVAVVVTAKAVFHGKDAYGDDFDEDVYIKLCTDGFDPSAKTRSVFSPLDDPCRQAKYFVTEPNPDEDVLGLVGEIKAGETRDYSLGAAWYEVTEIEALSNNIATFTSTTIGSDSEGSIGDEEIIDVVGVTAQMVSETPYASSYFDYIMPGEDAYSLAFSSIGIEDNEYTSYVKHLAMRGSFTNNTDDRWSYVTVYGFPADSEGNRITIDGEVQPIVINVDHIKPGESKEIEGLCSGDGWFDYSGPEVVGLDVVAIKCTIDD